MGAGHAEENRRTVSENFFARGIGGGYLRIDTIELVWKEYAVQKTDADWMRLAIETTRTGLSKGQTPFGAVITRDNELVVAAHNVVWETTDITAHAEVNAIRLAGRKLGGIDLHGCTIF